MQHQISRNNHYVPKWYQRGFLPNGCHKLHVLNLDPTTQSRVDGRLDIEAEIYQVAPSSAFVELDLYTTRLGHSLNDEIERFLFGEIDRIGATAVRGWIAGDLVKIHRQFQDFFVYMDAQKLRTPKGLDWILNHFQCLPQTELMMQMQALRRMHCVMWSECVREIVSAAKSSVKFLVSDHPVTVYHPKLSPDADECRYPGDPGVELMGSQTIFALDANHCLILTNLEYAEDPAGAALLSRRTNARFRGDYIARADALIRGRELNEGEVHAVNFVLKSRAKRHVAAGNPAWLHPERYCSLTWESIGNILRPKEELWRFGGEIYMGFKDGTSAYRDAFGRTTMAHKYLTKPPLKEDPSLDAPCGCGGGLAFRDCCAEIPPRMRPSWNVMGIRERNLVLIRRVKDLFRINEENATWMDVRRDLSDDKVRRIHELYAALWPSDTRLIDLLPCPQSKRSRALFLGTTDARKLSSTVTGMLAYVDELVVVHPFVNPNGVRPDYSPTQHPEQFRSQTLRSVFVLMVLEPHIRSGRVHLVPDPLEYDTGFRNEIMAITAGFDDAIQLGPIDEASLRARNQDEVMRVIKQLPPADLKAYIEQHLPENSVEFTETDIDAVVRLWKEEVVADPLGLLDPSSSPYEGGEYTVMKSFARETGLFIATLTGSFVYTDSDTQWARLHETDGIHSYEPDPAGSEAVHKLEGLELQVPKPEAFDESEPYNSGRTRGLLKQVALALRSGAPLGVDAQNSVEEPLSSVEQDLVTYRLRPSVPLQGFQRTDVSRLVLTFGRISDLAPVRLGLFLEPQSRSN